MLELTLFCKSYRNDLLRVVRLAQSIRQFNSEAIPFYVSVPEQDHALFSEKLTEFDVILLTDEDRCCMVSLVISMQIFDLLTP